MKNWHLHHSFSEGMEVSQIIEQLLEARGYVTEEARKNFLAPRLQHLADPLRLPDIEPAIERVEKALRDGDPILLYSDYDVDGMTSGALLYRFLSFLGGRVEVFLPERLSEGYGLTQAGIARALQEHPCKLLIALDCGTTNVDEVDFLISEGIDVIIIDHHQLPPKLPRALAFINPQRTLYDHALATVGLVFKFCHGLLKLRPTSNLFDLKQLLDLVALGTVVDLVPLTGDNRIFVKQGLLQMNRTSCVGLRELIKRAGIRRRLTPLVCAFTLGPRLNASGRMAQAQLGWQLLTTDDFPRARQLAEQLEQLNQQRQGVEHQVMLQAQAMIAESFDPEKDCCIVIGSRQWHPGVVGIIASRIAKEYYCPAIVISIGPEGIGKGSCRSIEGCSMTEALNACHNCLITFGGHAMAAGLEILEEQIDAFRNQFNQWLGQHLEDDIFCPKLKIDFELRGDQLDQDLAYLLATLEPFGQSNPAPVFMVREAEIVDSPQAFGRNHLRFKARAEGTDFDVIGFGFAHQKPVGRVDLAGQWEMDQFTGVPCLRMLDWK